MSSLRKSHQTTGTTRRLRAVLAGLGFLQAAVSPLWASTDADALSLPALLAEARQSNPDLLAAKKRWEAAQARVPLAKGLPPPRLGVEFEDIPKGTVRVDQATIMYQLLQAIPWPGKLGLRQQVAMKEAQIAALAFKQAEWEIESDLKRTYYELYLLDRQLELAREEAVWFEQATVSASARYASGAASQAELLMAQAKALEAQTEVAELGHRRQAMAAHLNHLLNRPVHHPLGSPGPLELHALEYSPDELLLLAQIRQPELQVFQFMAERSDLGVRLAKRELLPDLETMFELRNPAMGPVGPWDLTLAVVLPFWFWTKLRYGVKVALRDQESARAAYQAMRNEITKRIHEHWHEAAGTYAAARAGRDGLVPLARHTVEASLAGYRSGRGSWMEVQAALEALRQRQRAYYEQLISLEQHVAMLEQASGVVLRVAHARAREDAMEAALQSGGVRR
jgi:outer membrane protein TolC